MGCTKSSQAQRTEGPVRCESYELPHDERTQLAVQRFNAGSPAEAMCDLELRTSRDAASWLHHTPGLDCVVLGELLGDLQQVVLLEAYVHKLNVGGRSLESSMRMLLRGFRLPGEAQKIDRIVDCFAHHWASSHDSDEPGEIAMSADAAYVVCFALLLLNTDLHNPSVKSKMSLQTFQRSLEGVAAGANLPREWTRQFYEHIRDNEINLDRAYTKRREPAALLSDLSAEASRELQLTRKFKCAVRVVEASHTLLTTLSRLQTTPKESALKSPLRPIADNGVNQREGDRMRDAVNEASPTTRV